MRKIISIRIGETMTRKTKDNYRTNMLKTDRTKRVIKPKGIFDDITMSDILEGFGNKNTNKRSIRDAANGYRWTVNQVRWN